MRILLVNDWYYPNMIGGAEHSTKLLAESLQKRGHEVYIYCIDKTKSSGKDLIIEDINNVKVIRGNGGKYDLYSSNDSTLTEKIRLKGGFHWYFYILKKINQKVIEIYNPSIKDEIRKVLEISHPDIVHTSCIAGISTIIWKIAKTKSIIVCHTLRDYWLLSPFKDQNLDNIKGKKKIIQSIYSKFCKIFTKKYIDIVTAPSEYTLNQFLEKKFFSNAKIKIVIPNSIVLDYNKFEDYIRIRKLHNFSKNILFVGRLQENKGIMTLINHFSLEEFKKFNLKIAGTGELYDEIVAISNVQNNIIPLGKLEPINLKKEYENSDLLIVPSEWGEPFGRVIIEAFETGMPVICNNAGGMPEIIKNTDGGIITDTKNNNLLYSAINSIYENYDHYIKNIAENTHKYDINDQVNAFLELYSLFFKGGIYYE